MFSTYTMTVKQVAYQHQPTADFEECKKVFFFIDHKSQKVNPSKWLVTTNGYSIVMGACQIKTCH